MSGAARRLLVGGNWKSNGSKKFIQDFSKTVLNNIKYDKKKVEIVVAPVSIHLRDAMESIHNGIHISSQNLSAFDDGAYTGEVSTTQLVDLGIKWTILGHSERRHIFGESNQFVATKVKKADDYGLKIIACIGEKLEERKSGKTMEVCEGQLGAIRDKIEDWSNIVIAYEPVWAIGTGVTATSEQAQETHYEVRNWLEKNVSKEAADKTRILYGGSVTDKNASELIKNPDVDGFLVGGASLKPAFDAIIKACNEVSK